MGFDSISFKWGNDWTDDYSVSHKYWWGLEESLREIVIMWSLKSSTAELLMKFW